MKLKAHALYFVLIVAAFVGLFTTSFILTTFYHKTVELNADISRKLLSNAYSGFKVLQYGNSERFLEPTWIDLFAEESDSVELSLRPFGLFYWAKSKAVHGNDQHEIQGLLGFKSNFFNNTALHLGADVKAVHICGSTILQGDVYLPEQGIERNYIEGQSYTRADLFEGTKFTSSGLPDLPDNVLQSIQRIKNLQFFTDTTIVWEKYEEPEEKGSQITLLTSSEKIFFNKTLKGKFIVYSPIEIMVSSGITTDNLVLVAPKIVFESGFTGAVQAFAFQELIADKYTNFTYPSVLGIIKNNTVVNDITCILTLSENSKLDGVIIGMQDEFGLKNNLKIVLEKYTEVRGQVYSKGYVALSGKVTGNVYAQKLWLKTNSSVYENQLLNTQVIASELDSGFVGLSMGKNAGHLEVVQWGNSFDNSLIR